MTKSPNKRSTPTCSTGDKQPYIYVKQIMFMKKSDKKSPSNEPQVIDNMSVVDWTVLLYIHNKHDGEELSTKQK
jgi:hypothetical protein